MVLSKSFLLFLFLCSTSAVNISFKNVTFHGYSVFVHKFEKIIASSNYLKDELPKALFDAIEMKHQKIPILYEGCISDIQELDELILEDDGIMEIEPGALKNLSGIRVIKLKNNNLKTIRAGVFNELPVSDLDLSQNQISLIEETAFDDMEALMNIRLTDNKISDWNINWFRNTPLLTRVSLQHNLIQELKPLSFKNMVGIKKFSRVQLQLNLIFSYNKIKQLYPDTFKGLHEIRNLWLDNNLLENLPTNIFSGISIDTLRLNHNNFSCIEDKESILKASSNNIDGNPLECTCLSNIKKWAETNNKSVELFYSDMNCYAMRIKKKMDELDNLLKQNDIKDQK